MRLTYWLLLGTMLCVSCGPDDGPEPPETETEAEVQSKLLQAHTWVPGTITRDGQAVADDFPAFADFTLKFSGSLNADRTNVTNGTYDTNVDGPILPDGSWELKPGAVKTTLLLTDPANDQIEANYTVSATSLRLSFVRDVSNGRTTEISGNYVFDLVPQ